jgi:endonuclease VIII-like 1
VPEYWEVRKNAELVNTYATEYRTAYAPQKTKNPMIIIPENSKAFADTRGKELSLSFSGVSYRFNLGMSGMFFISPSQPDNLGPKIMKNVLLIFEPQHKDEGWLCFHDVRRFAKWKETYTWGKNRGPDPLKESQDFINNIERSLNSKEFQKPIYEVMMNQKYFNGVGNFLRADLLASIDDTPFQSAADWYSKHPTFSEFIIDYLKDLGQLTSSNYTTQDHPGYQKGACIPDRNGRNFWYDPKWSNKKI